MRDAQITHDKEFSGQHDLFIATTMNHVDAVLMNLRHQVFGFNKARRGEFSLDMVDLQLLKLALEELNRKALKQGFTLSVSHPLELEGLGATVVLEHDALHLIVSIPVLERDPFDLYKLMTVAMPTAMPKAQKGKRHYMRFDPERKFIAINSDNTVYTELAADDLSQCKIYTVRFKSMNPRYNIRMY